MERFEKPLLRFAAGLVGASLAQDVVQDTFFKLCQKPQAEVERHLCAWLFTVAKNRALDLLRRNEKNDALPQEQDLQSPDSSPQIKLERAEAVGRLQRRLAELSDRKLENRDFTDDTKDAGEMGADHVVTALYEIVPRGTPIPGVGEGSVLRYQKPGKPTGAAESEELFTVKVRYKLPEGEKSRELEFPLQDSESGLASASGDFRWAAAVASFGMVLLNSKHRGAADFSSVLKLAQPAAGKDNYRREMLELVQTARKINGRKGSPPRKKPSADLKLYRYGL